MSLTEMCDLLEGDDPKVLLGRLASAMTVIREVIGAPRARQAASPFRMTPCMWRWTLSSAFICKPWRNFKQAALTVEWWPWNAASLLKVVKGLSTHWAFIDFRQCWARKIWRDFFGLPTRNEHALSMVLSFKPVISIPEAMVFSQNFGWWTPIPARQAVVWNGNVWFFGGYTKKETRWFVYLRHPNRSDRSGTTGTSARKWRQL